MPRIVEALEVPDLGHHRHSHDERDPAHRLHGFHHRRQRPAWQQGRDLTRQPLDPVPRRRLRHRHSPSVSAERIFPKSASVVSKIFRTFSQATAPWVEVCSAKSGAMFMYLRVDQWLPAMWRRRAAARFRQL